MGYRGQRKGSYGSFHRSRSTSRKHKSNKAENDFVTLLNTDKREYRDNLKEGRGLDESQFTPFLGKNVVIETSKGSTLQGKVVQGTKGIMIMPKGSRTKGHYLTAGLFDQFYGTITVRKISLA